MLQAKIPRKYDCVGGAEHRFCDFIDCLCPFRHCWYADKKSRELSVAENPWKSPDFVVHPDLDDAGRESDALRHRFAANIVIEYGMLAKICV
jgi:hypothetical protein